jgi:hypothetical protein
VGVAVLRETTGFWIPTVRVTWRDAGRDQKFEIDGPSHRFETRDAAEDYAILMGREWIDKNKPIP